MKNHFGNPSPLCGKLPVGSPQNSIVTRTFNGFLFCSRQPAEKSAVGDLWRRDVHVISQYWWNPILQLFGNGKCYCRNHTKTNILFAQSNMFYMYYLKYIMKTDQFQCDLQVQDVITPPGSTKLAINITSWYRCKLNAVIEWCTYVEFAYKYHQYCSITVHILRKIWTESVTEINPLVNVVPSQRSCELSEGVASWVNTDDSRTIDTDLIAIWRHWATRS